MQVVDTIRHSCARFLRAEPRTNGHLPGPPGGPRLDQHLPGPRHACGNAGRRLFTQCFLTRRCMFQEQFRSVSRFMSVISCCLKHM